MAHRAALFTFAVFEKPEAHPANAGFHALNDPILDAAARAPGFLGRAMDHPGPGSWGREVYPAFYEEKGDGWTPATLSLWRDLESVMAFAYSGLHARALARRREWFRKGDWPAYVLWWVAADHVPDWPEAVARHAALHEEGPAPRAFDFARPFDPAGRPAAIDRARVGRLAGRQA